MIYPAIPQYLSSGVKAPASAPQTQFAATTTAEGPEARQMSANAYARFHEGSQRPPAGAWVPDDNDQYNFQPAGEEAK